MVGRFRMSDTAETSIRRGSADDMVLNPNLDVLSAITRGSCNLRGENHILLYLNFSSIVFMWEEHCMEHVI